MRISRRAMGASDSLWSSGWGADVKRLCQVFYGDVRQLFFVAEKIFHDLVVWFAGNTVIGIFGHAVIVQEIQGPRTCEQWRPYLLCRLPAFPCLLRVTSVDGAVYWLKLFESNGFSCILWYGNKRLIGSCHTGRYGNEGCSYRIQRFQSTTWFDSIIVTFNTFIN